MKHAANETTRPGFKHVGIQSDPLRHANADSGSEWFPAATAQSSFYTTLHRQQRI